MSPGWLIDKSAYVRLAESPDMALWLDAITRGLVSVSTLTLLEMGWSARSEDDWKVSLKTPPVAAMVPALVTPAAEERAVEVQGMLAARGHHRGPGVADLLIAATAEVSGLTVLHVDRDFELIADVTGQPLERLAGDW